MVLSFSDTPIHTDTEFHNLDDTNPCPLIHALYMRSPAFAVKLRNVMGHGRPLCVPKRASKVSSQPGVLQGVVGKPNQWPRLVTFVVSKSVIPGFFTFQVDPKPKFQRPHISISSPTGATLNHAFFAIWGRPATSPQTSPV